jgi:pyruvate/2-oxoglutarate dehydrogenase complex dihydrolipoamide acyltransferase (E2) component
MAYVKCKKLKTTSAFRKIAVGTWQTAYDPSIYGTLTMRADKVNDYIQKFREKTGKRLTMTHVVAKTVGKALEACPEANAVLRRNKIWLRETIDVSLLVLMEDEGKIDLSSTKIGDIDKKGLVQIVTEVEEHVARIRAKKDKTLEKTRQSMKLIPWMFINTFMKIISFLGFGLNLNLELFGIPKDPFGGAVVTSIGPLGLDIGYVPLVPYSRVPIWVAPGEIMDAPVVEDGQIVVGKVININATLDHRVIDGGHAAMFAKSVRAVFDDPFGQLDPLD